MMAPRYWRACSGAIRSLDLNYNDIGPRGAAAIADSLKTTSLGSLTMSEEIGDEGAEALADALRSGASIRSFTLGESSL